MASSFLVFLLTLLSCKATIFDSADVKDVKAEQRPNIILLMLDDLQDESYLPFWQAMPKLKALVNEGMHFNNAFAPSPICCPGRVTALSGLYGQNSGVFTIAGPYGAEAFQNPAKLNKTVASYLAKLGYKNVLIGKSWKVPRGKPSAASIEPGWFEWHELHGEGMYQGYNYLLREGAIGIKVEDINYTGRSQYSTFVFGLKAGRFISQRWDPAQGPFFMWLSPTAPHLPLDAPTHDLADKYIGFDKEAQTRWGPMAAEHFPVESLPNFGAKDTLSGKPAWLKQQALARESILSYVREEYPRRMGSLYALDKMLDDLSKTMQQKKLRDGSSAWDHTIFIVTSDNGYNNGAHRLIHKMAPYEESLRVPLYVFGPGIAKGNIEALVGLQDLAPTIIELAQGQVPDHMDGRSFAPMLRSGSDDPNWRDAFVGEYKTGGVNPGEAPPWVKNNKDLTKAWKLDIPSYRVLRTKRHSYIEWAGGFAELYDLSTDKWQQNNLLHSDPTQNQELVKKLRQQLNSQANCTGRSGNSAQGRPACP